MKYLPLSNMIFIEIKSCEKNTKKQGCTKLDLSFFPFLLANNRDGSSNVFTGTHLDWGKFPVHLRRYEKVVIVFLRLQQGLKQINKKIEFKEYFNVVIKKS